MVSNGDSASKATPGSPSSRITNTYNTENRGSTNDGSEAVEIIVEEFLERDILSEAVAEEVTRLKAADNHREALSLIVEDRRSRTL